MGNSKVKTATEQAKDAMALCSKEYGVKLSMGEVISGLDNEVLSSVYFETSYALKQERERKEEEEILSYIFQLIGYDESNPDHDKFDTSSVIDDYNNIPFCEVVTNGKAELKSAVITHKQFSRLKQCKAGDLLICNNPFAGIGSYLVETTENGVDGGLPTFKTVDDGIIVTACQLAHDNDVKFQ